MTVKELISELEKMPQDYKVCANLKDIKSVYVFSDYRFGDKKSEDVVYLDDVKGKH